MAQDHYFSANPEAAHRSQRFREQVGGESFEFMTDSGTFSRSGLDRGSRCLIETARCLPDFPERGKILDLGCGWGPVAVILARFYPEASWCLLDVNERAVSLAEKNFCRNHPHLNARFLVSDGLKACDTQFDLILQNPPIRAGKEVIYRLFQEARAALLPGGRYLMVMRKQQGAESAMRELQKIYGNTVVTLSRSGGYHVLMASAPALEEG